EARGLARGEHRLAPELLRERAAVHELERDDGLAVDHVGVVDDDDPRMAEARRRARLPEERLARLGALGGREDLERHLAPQAPVLGAQDAGLPRRSPGPEAGSQRREALPSILEAREALDARILDRLLAGRDDRVVL